MTEEGVIRAKKIELEDGDGNARAMLDGEGLADGFVDLVVNGGDGRVAAITLGRSCWGSATPSLPCT